MAFTAVDGRKLVHAHRDGDEGAFPELVRTHRSALLARARYRLSDDQAAEDAVQECFLRAYRAMPSFGEAGEWHVSAWLYRILENVCIDESNRRRRLLAVVERLAAQPEELAPDAESAARLANPQVTEAIAGLPAPYRDALIQREIDGLSYADMAAAAGITEDNARARVSRARSALRRLIGPVVAAYAWLVGTARRGDRILLDGTSHAASSNSAAGAVAAPAAAHLPAATQLISQVTAVVPESQLVSAIKVATAAVIAVAVPVSGVTAVNRTTPMAQLPPAIEITQSAAEADDGLGMSAGTTTATSSDDETTAASDDSAITGDAGAVPPLSEAIAAEVDAEEEAAATEASGDEGAAAEETPPEDGATTSGETEEAGGPASDDTATDDTASDDTATTEETSPAPEQPASAVVLDTTTVYRNTLDDGRFELAGPTSFSTAAGDFAGRLSITCAVPAEGDAPGEEYRLGGSLVITGDNSGRIRLSGVMEAWWVDEDGVTTYVFSGRYTVTDGEGYGIPLKGDFTASFRDTGRSDLVVRLLPKGSTDTTA